MTRQFKGAVRGKHGGFHSEFMLEGTVVDARVPRGHNQQATIVVDEGKRLRDSCRLHPDGLGGQLDGRTGYGELQDIRIPAELRQVGSYCFNGHNGAISFDSSESSDLLNSSVLSQTTQACKVEYGMKRKQIAWGGAFPYHRSMNHHIETTTSIRGLLDTHFHTQAMDRKGIDTLKLLEDLFAQGFAGGIDVGVDDDDLPLRTPLLDKFPQLKLSAGIGPWGVEDGKPSIDDQLTKLTQVLGRHPVHAVGEIGLDNYWHYGTPQTQEALFIRQIELADTLGVPIIVHNREADTRTQEIIKQHPPKQGGILHCFSGTQELADMALERGFYISFAGPITYKRNDGLREILARIPIERVLLETDSPYLPPEPFRGMPNTPQRMPYIYDKAAEVKDISVGELAEQLRRNFATLFSQADRS